MNEEHKDVQAPNFEGEKMKMPKNSSTPPLVADSDTPNNINGLLLLVLTVLLLLILGGLYYWFSTLNVVPNVEPLPAVERPTTEENNEPESPTAEAQTEAIRTTSTSDEVDSIEADLESTTVFLEEIDAEMVAIEAELDAGLSEI